MAPWSSNHFNRGVGSVVRGASKAQASLAKIMAVISTVRPCDLTLLSSSKSDGGGGGSSSKAAANIFDLNLRLDLEMVEEEGGGDGDRGAQDRLVTDPPVATAAAEEKSSEDDDDGEEAIEMEKSEMTNVEQHDHQSKGSSSSTASSSSSTGSWRNGEGLDLLIQVLGDELEPLPPPPEAEAEKETEQVENNKRSVRRPSSKTKTKKRARETTTTMRWLDWYEESAPLVRSKRGRNQALPSRYRDTVLEPWVKLPTVSRHGRPRQH